MKCALAWLRVLWWYALSRYWFRWRIRIQFRIRVQRKQLLGPLQYARWLAISEDLFTTDRPYTLTAREALGREGRA